MHLSVYTIIHNYTYLLLLINSKVHSHSVDPRKLCGVSIAIKYTPLSMAYYAYELTLSFGLTTIIIMYIKRMAL